MEYFKIQDYQRHVPNRTCFFIFQIFPEMSAMKCTEKPTKVAPGFHVRPWCWIVERTFSWLNKNRSLSKDYECLMETSEALIQIAMIRIMARRLALEG